MAADNRTLGRFMLDGILPAPRGMPQIEVSFDIDANGILSVKAHDKGTGREQKITITASSGLSKDEVERMKREADMHAAEDARRREEVEARNMADTLVYTAERTLRDLGDKVPAPVRSEVESKVSALKAALQGGDAQQLKRLTQELSEAMQKVGAAVYQQQGGAGGPGAPPPPPGGGEGPGKKDEGTVEGEFREV
jgi:molecular chaperone DnaK